MDRVLQCDCGFEVRAADEHGLADGVRRHALEAHRMTLSSDEALLLAARAEPAEGVSPRANDNKEET